MKTILLALLTSVLGVAQAATFGVTAKQQANPASNIVIVKPVEPLNTPTSANNEDEGSSVSLPSISQKTLVFQALLSDQTVRGVINRWLHTAGLQEVIWQLYDDIVIEREVNFYATDLDSALTELMQATNNTEPARACRHINGVVRIIPRTLFCE